MQVYGYITALNSFGEVHVMPLQAVLVQIWKMVQPRSKYSKPRVGLGVRPENSDHRKTTHTRSSPIRDRLFQSWRKEVAAVPDTESFTTRPIEREEVV